MLTMRRLKVRYRQTYIGILWVLFQPLTMMAVMSVVFGYRGLGIEDSSVPYPLFILSGFVVWQFFTRAFSEGTQCLFGERALMSRVYFPRLIIPISVIICATIDLLMPLLLVLLSSLIFVPELLGWRVTLVPFFILLQVVFTFGVILWTSALNVKFRDIQMLIPFITLVLMFVSPIVFPLQHLPNSVRAILSVNPIAVSVEGVRWALYGVHWIGVLQISAACFISILLLVSGLIVFQRQQRVVDDYI